jgi:hypothetical protein
METIEHTETEYVLDSSCEIIDLKSRHNETIIYVTTCKIGATGHTGEIGPFGPTGPTGADSLIMGPTGPTGEKGTISNTFIYVYTIKEQTVLQNNPVIFDQASCLIGHCIHIPDTSEIWVWKPGYYQISVHINQLEASQISVVKNGTMNLTGATIGSLSGSSLSTTFITQILDTDINIETTNSTTGVACKIQVVNNTVHYPSITLYAAESAGNTIPQNSASFSMILLY